MSRFALVLTILVASVSLASLARADETTTVHTDNSGDTTTTHTTNTPATTHTTTVHSHRHYHHRFHPVHEASRIIHDATGTEPTRPKPEN